MLPKRNRLRNSDRINEIKTSGEIEGKSALLCLKVKSNNDNSSKIAIVTPKKLGNAVERNKIRRRIKSIFIDIRQNINNGLDIVIFPRTAIITKNSLEIKENMIKVAKQCGIFQEKSLSS